MVGAAKCQGCVADTPHSRPIPTESAETGRVGFSRPMQRFVCFRMRVLSFFVSSRRVLDRTGKQTKKRQEETERASEKSTNAAWLGRLPAVGRADQPTLFLSENYLVSLSADEGVAASTRWPSAPCQSRRVVADMGNGCRVATLSNNRESCRNVIHTTRWPSRCLCPEGVT